MSNTQIFSDIPFINIPADDWVGVKKMKSLDKLAVKKYGLPVELMMENAGYLLARLASKFVGKSEKILVGVGPGNNGGGGLAAARRLKAWGYDVSVDIPMGRLRGEPGNQWKIAKKFGIENEIPEYTTLFIDAYFGFSQKLPLPKDIEQRILEVDERGMEIISLDLPTGISEAAKTLDNIHIKPNHTLTLAYPKTLLKDSRLENQNVFIADIGIPNSAYSEEGINYPDFQNGKALFQVAC